ncbi:CCA tRNA nucleotidyltransferase [uncultured Sphingorhabdus sp.]|mgnify:FL=1|uniref:CCA tRNA nucleotidyltransferase n=1 Tax=uncultured Sphingorhabdus sp. TaxID=1686106 RepID=UPI00260620D8|nr:CCA tRNA nucleotidyltransferase [uncultured Sphingorhabdus sp.]HMS19392.1 CCA tRNA nucleotidyltransferase [Sphingorhabdus sp.]
MQLRDAPWLHDLALRRVIDALTVDGQSPRIVGGAVRDALLGIEVADVDIATPLVPGEIIRRLEAARIKAVPTGIDHGTITAVVDGHTFEITTLRRDVSTDGRRATVEFATDWIEDAARRDFTINALYADPESREIFDYFDGQTDLKAHHVRFIGDADQRIAEDHLRILRLFRFHARFGQGAIDADALRTASAHANKLMALSRERIADELRKLLSVANPAPAVQAMLDHGIFASFLPEIVSEAGRKLAHLIEREQLTASKASVSRRLSAILPVDTAIVEKVAARLKLSNRLRTDLMHLAANAKSDQSARQLAYAIGLENARDIILLNSEHKNWREELASLQDWEVPELPVKGGDLIAKGLRAGPVVAKTLQAIERQWVAESFPAESRVREIADQLVAGTLRDDKKA